MADYNITRVSNQPPEDWSFDDKRTGMPVAMKKYKIMVEGVSEPIEISKKANLPVPAVNDVLTGTIVESKYGKRFQAERKPFTPQSGAPAAYNKDQGIITAQWAIGQAVQLMLANYTGGKPFDWVQLEVDANKLFVLASIVKTSGTENAKYQDNARGGQTFSDGSPVDGFDALFSPGDEQVNLDEIPF